MFYIISIIVAVAAIFLTYFKWSYQYWNRKNVPNLPPTIPFGNTKNPFTTPEHIGIQLQHLYKEMKAKGWKHGGIYILAQPQYIPIHLDYVKNILTKDFHHFMDRNIYFNEEADPISAHLLNLTGNKWKNLRAKLTPTFTSGKMKAMFQTLAECQTNLKNKMEAQWRSKAPVDIKDILACFTTDIIGSCAFGLNCKSIEEEESPFRHYGKKIFEPNRARLFRRLFSSNFPHIARLLGIVSTPKDVSRFFMQMVDNTVSYREKNNVTRNDFLQLLINMKNSNPGDESSLHLTPEQMAAQSFVFFAAGFETSSTLMSFALYELAKNEDIQDRVRAEIRTILAQHGDNITYDSLQDMKYLEQVIDETLRKYPPASITNRKCVEDYKVPGEDVVIKKGTAVLIPIMGIHYDEEYYPNPEKFDPERFSEENRSSIPHYAHLPFGEGPRSCIGMRFGLMQAKMGLTALLKDYRFKVSSKTREPLVMAPNTLILTVVGEVWLNVEKI